MMSILSELMDLFTGVSSVANVNSLSNNTNGFASNESGTRQQYASASPDTKGILVRQEDTMVARKFTTIQTPLWFRTIIIRA
jgi:hypothetical protein